MDAIRHIIASSGLHPGAGSDSGIDACTSSVSCASSTSQIQPNHSQSEATSSALHDDSDVNLPADDCPLTEDEAVSDDDGCPHDGEDILVNRIDVSVTPGGYVDNNRLFQPQIGAGGGSCARLSDRGGRLASKEEKQRQNEEIVIMESSSVSSETGSWESVFPQRTPTAAAATETVNTGTPIAGPSGESILPLETTTVRVEKEKQRLPEFSFSSKPMCSAAAACFIDASSLMDDTELYASQNGPHLPEVGCCGPKPSDDMGVDPDPDVHSPNLSDEQKLLHRSVPESTDSYDIKDQFSLGSQHTHSTSESPPDSTVPSSQDEGISIQTTSDPESRVRQDLERKQGHFLFRNSIQHYSGNVVAPHRISSGFHDDNQSDLSLPSIYSTGSGEYGQPYASLNSSNFGDYGGATSDAESGFYPDTPHNSIIHIESPLPTRPVPAVRTKPADQVCRGEEEKPAEIRHTPFDSPSVRRKTETCPILSGGLLPEDLPAEREKPVREKSISSSLNSWVVDMSDCNQSPKLSDREAAPRTSRSLDPKRFATGFYVDMSDSDCSLPPTTKETTETSEDKKNIFSMFIDFGDKKVVPRKEPASFTSRLSSSIQKQRELANSSDTESDREHKTPSSSFVRRTPASVRRNPPDPKNRHSWNEPPPAKPVPSSSTTINPRQYNTSVSMPDGDNNSIMSIFDKIPSLLGTKAITSSSMSIDSPISPYDDLTSCKSMSAYSNNSGKSLNTSHSVHSSIDDVAAAATNAKPTVRRRRQDVEINETFDKSSRSSLPEEILSTDDSSPITDTDDVTFQNDLDLDPAAQAVVDVEPTVVTVPAPHPPAVSTENPEHTMESLQAIIERQQKLLLETVAEELPAESSSFVKLSDMDKPAPKFELHGGAQLSKSVGATTNRIERLFADSAKQSRGRNPWHSMSRSTGNNNLTTLASSSDNLKSLSRLFPHLKELSNSLPSDIQQQSGLDQATSPAASHQKSPGQQDTNYYCADGGQDLSAASSVTSSFSRSAIDSADESSLSYRQPRRLGEDLLKMFLQEIATDVTLEVGGRKMRAHKCILRSRCQYFAAILAGNWVQSAGNIIQLAGYSYDSVHFALCHIYSGAAHPPEGISLIELAALADLLGLEGLKEVTAYALRMQYCHNFHKPCSGCLDGILRVFPVTLSYGLDDLYRKCLRWTCKHYVSVWPTRNFADLPADIIARCSQHLVAHMNSETVLDTILECELILSLVVTCRWALNIENTVRDIIDTADAYLSDHFASLVASDGFLSLGQDKSWDILRLENLILRTASTLTPEQACRSYQRITRLHAVLIKSRTASKSDAEDAKMDGSETTRALHRRPLDEEIHWKPEFLRLVADVLNAVEHCLVGQCSRAMRTNQWQRMDLELRKKVQQMAGLSDAAAAAEQRRSGGSNLAKPLVYQSASSSSIGSYSNSNTTSANKRSQDLYAVKLAIQAQSKRAQDSHHRYRDHQTQRSTHPPERPTTLHIRPDRSHNVWSNVHESRAPDRGASERSSLRGIPKVSVPDVVPKAAISKPSHRRTQSESHPIKASRLGEIRPRYLEPKLPAPQPQQRSASSTSANLHPAVNVTEINLSSSGESSTRTSKLALNKRLAGSSKSNMSRDSLASPIKQAVKSQAKQAASEVDLSVDSLGGSMHSSIKSRSNKSMSQESLVRFNATVRAKNLMTASAHMATASRLRQPKAISSTENSPGSVTTNTTTATKSSRLSSVNSATSSPRDIAFRRTGAPPQLAPLRRSFVSAKSREILAAKQNALNRAESTRSVPSSTNSATCIPVNKSSSASNVTNKRPVSFPTTLHLRRTAKLSPQPANGVDVVAYPDTSTKSVKSPFLPGGSNPLKSVDIKSKAELSKSNVRRVEKVSSKVSSKCNAKAIATTTNNRIKGASTSTSANGVRKAAPLEIELAVQPEDEEFVAPMAATRVESKLERSSTFCKESSSLDATELQVIE